MVAVRGCFKILCYAFCSAPVRFTLQLSEYRLEIVCRSRRAIIRMQKGVSAGHTPKETPYLILLLACT